MHEMYEIAQLAKYRVLGIDEVYIIGDGWNVRNSKLVMDEMYEIRHKIRKVSTDYCVAPLHKCSYDLIVSLAALLWSLNMNTPESALSQL